eukprot:GHVU01119511.1.p1 GENE.GHVU01119511.1~~GHVU01119511.1.p1  ORF type:complete len:246 (-),score=16.74 GHVU01119511.1:730-1467(-)
MDNIIVQLVSEQEEIITEQQELLLQMMDPALSVDHAVERHGGSRPGRSPNIPRDFVAADRRLHQRYFLDNQADSYYETFRRRFRIRRERFDAILRRFTENGYLKQGWDATGKPGASTRLKLTVAFRYLAYGIAYDAWDEAWDVAESTVAAYVKDFCRHMVHAFGPEYLRTPTHAEVSSMLARNEQRGFPGMAMSIDCMHVRWVNCPYAYKGQFVGKSKSPTVVLEAAVSEDLRMWHFFFRCSWLQ